MAITPDDIRGHIINPNALVEIIDSVDFVVAHRAHCIRAFVERDFPMFPTLPWSCSQTDIDWCQEGAEGDHLRDALALHGLFRASHRACANAKALLHLISLPLIATKSTGFRLLMEAAHAPRLLIVAAKAPCLAAAALRARGYRWSPADPNAWYRTVPDEIAVAELKWLAQYVYAGTGREPLVAALGGEDRFLPIQRHAAKLVPVSVHCGDLIV